MSCPTCQNAFTSAGVCPRCASGGRKRWDLKVKVSKQGIIEAARTALGIPFLHRGRSAEGIDCIGLLFHIAKVTGLDQNMNQPDYYQNLKYSRAPARQGPDSHWLLRELAASFDRIPPARACASDIIYCRNRRWVHVGIITPDTMIHASSFPQKKVVETMYGEHWKKITVAAFHWPGAI